MFPEHEILINRDEVLEILRFYGLRNCLCTEDFVVSTMKALETGKKVETRFLLLAADLLERYDLLETKKEGGAYRLYGHDAEGKKHLAATSWPTFEL